MSEEDLPKGPVRFNVFTGETGFVSEIGGVYHRAGEDALILLDRDHLPVPNIKTVTDSSGQMFAFEGADAASVFQLSNADVKELVIAEAARLPLCTPDGSLPAGLRIGSPAKTAPTGKVAKALGPKGGEGAVDKGDGKGPTSDGDVGDDEEDEEGQERRDSDELLKKGDGGAIETGNGNANPRPVQPGKETTK